MSAGRLKIDGKDAYTEYGVYVTSDGWAELVCAPPLKTPVSNDWQEEDGVELDLSSPVLNMREVSVKMAVVDIDGRFRRLISLLSSGAYHTFDCLHIKRKYKLRLVSMTNVVVLDGLGFVTFKFADDFPLPGYSYVAPQSSLTGSDGYYIDGSPLYRYGVRVLRGSLDEVRKAPDVKTNLLRNTSGRPGASYDAKKVTYKSRDVNLYCLMRADSLDELWRNYDALLYDLIRPETRTLGAGAIGKSFKCAYKSCKVTEFFPEGRIWFTFVLSLTFLDGGVIR